MNGAIDSHRQINLVAAILLARSRVAPTTLRAEPDLVERTADTVPPIQHVRVDHRRAHIAMAEQLLNRPNVIARFEKVGANE
jgi:hypothetical protein